MPSTQDRVNTEAGGSLLDTTTMDAFALLEKLAIVKDQYPMEKRIMKRDPLMPKVELFKSLTLEVANLVASFKGQEAKAVEATSHDKCSLCSGAHPIDYCTEIEDANLVENYNRPNDQNSENYYNGAKKKEEPQKPLGNAVGSSTTATSTSTLLLSSTTTLPTTPSKPLQQRTQP